MDSTLCDQTEAQKILSKLRRRGKHTVGKPTLSSLAILGEINISEDMDLANEVCVYAKSLRGRLDSPPVCNYSPDWLMDFNKGTVKHIFFIAETKGTMETLNLKSVEQAKINCAKKLLNELSTADVFYHDVETYQDLIKYYGEIVG